MAQTTRTADVQPLMLPRPRAGRSRLAYRLARRLFGTVVPWGSVTLFPRRLDDGLISIPQGIPAPSPVGSPR
jgi:hypothetical protein